MRFLLLVILILAVSCTRSYYIVRHAEKAPAAAGMSSNVPLSAAGQQRAEALKEVVKGKKIAEVFSTNTIRTKSTAQPAAALFGKTISTYGPLPDSAFIALLKSKRKNILVIGHSNTVDDIANGLAGRKVVPGDIPEYQYDNLYIIKIRGNKALLKVWRAFAVEGPQSTLPGIFSLLSLCPSISIIRVSWKKCLPAPSLFL